MTGRECSTSGNGEHDFNWPSDWEGAPEGKCYYCSAAQPSAPAIDDGLATVFAICSTRTVAGVVADWWTVEITTTNGIETVKFASLQDLEVSLDGIKNAVHSMGYLIESDWEAVGHGFHAHAVTVDLPSRPVWADEVTGVAGREWSFLGSLESNGAALRHYGFDLLPDSERDNAGVRINQTDFFVSNTVLRGPATLAVNIDKYDMPLRSAAEIAEAINRAVKILAQENTGDATCSTAANFGGAN